MIELSTTRPLEAQLGCYGYFGFGSGVALALYGSADDDTGLYCNRCSVKALCWEQHRTRVRGLMPELTTLADQVAKTHQGSAYMREIARITGQSVKKVVEPYLVVMMGNMQDGGTIAHGGRPEDRGPGTLTWPLQRLAS